MPKKSAVHFLILFYATFFWSTGFLGIGGENGCLGGDGAAFFRSASSPASTFSRSNGNDNQPADHNTVGNFSCVSLPSACLSGETGGNRQLSSTQGRLVLLVRQLGGNAHAVRGGFGRVDEIRCQYGFVRPHLYFCQLLI